MSYEHHLKQKMPMCEIELNQILYRDPTLVNQFDRYRPHPIINRYEY